jgi:3-methyl-2-oxobutanoate hydroxymethyltransferase
MILVGDSLSMTVLGNMDTIPLTTDEMIHHIKAVVKGASSPIIVGDMVFGSYNEGSEQAIRTANRMMKEGGCDAVKLEGGRPDVVEALVRAGIPVQGHLGLTPQTASMLGGFKVQGKDLTAAQSILDSARALEEAGAFSIVLECVPEELARVITQALSVPTIGIGAGRYCDGQVLVFHDMLGLFDRFKPRFVKEYADLGSLAVKALEEYRDDVRNGSFPEEAHSFGGISAEDAAKLE